MRGGFAKAFRTFCLKITLLVPLLYQFQLFSTSIKVKILEIVKIIKNIDFFNMFI